MTDPPATCRVGVVGCGVIGKRVARAVAAQPDMALSGIAVRRRSPAVQALTARHAVPLFALSDPSAPERPTRDLTDLLASVDVVVDCGPRGTGQTRKDLYEGAHTKAVFCGGESHEAIGSTFCAATNYDAVYGATSTRVASCNTTAAARVLNALHHHWGVAFASVTYLRCASEPGRSTRGTVGAAWVDPAISHHAADLKVLMPGVDVSTRALTLPMTHGHLLHAVVRLRSPATTRMVQDALADTARVFVAPDSTPQLTSRLAPNAWRPSVWVWRDSVCARDGLVELLAHVHMESVTIPDAVDAIRALCRLAADADTSACRTDAALEHFDLPLIDRHAPKTHTTSTVV